VHGIFFWKIKTLLSTNYTRKYSSEELKKLIPEAILIHGSSDKIEREKAKKELLSVSKYKLLCHLYG
jgi:hypothetical protein